MLTNKKAIFFTIDALIALIIILFAVLVIYPAIKPKLYESELSGDIIKVLSSLKIGEINNSYVQQTLIPSGRITDLNKTILEQIGEFYVTDIATARILANSVLLTIDERENIGLWYGNELIASRNLTSMESASNVEVDRQIISGIQQGGSLTGFSARAYLTRSLQEKYFYFGGYVGDGNISININYNGTLEDIKLEVAANTNFRFCVNDDCCGAELLEPAESQFEPKEFPLKAYVSCFNSGDNIIKFYSSSEKNLFFAGGFIKIKYKSSGVYEQTNRYYFPGIEGLINIYDGFYVPGQLNEMKVFLHYNSTYKMFLNIGNVTVFNKSSNGGIVEETLDTAFLSSKLSYPSLSEKTIPIRLGLENVSVVVTSNADVISVVDMSGSSNQNIPDVDPPLKIVDAIKIASPEFVKAVLNVSSNRAGLVAYQSDADDETMNHDLSNDSASLNNTINNWKAGEPACLCCGILKARDKFLAQSDESRYRSMIVMSDGKPNEICPSLGVVGDLDGDGTADEADDYAIKAACMAAEDDIVVNVIGFGPETTINQDVLKNISACGKGTYYRSDYLDLADTYRELVKIIIEAAYEEQTIVIAGSAFTKLYPDSYIEFDYKRASIPYGLITTQEKKFNDKYSGNFSVSSELRVLDAAVISYSGSRWTDSVKINSDLVYKLSNYGKNYTELGDPYSIHIPFLLVRLDYNNIVNVTTGTSPTDSTSGSKDNKIIYTVIRDTTVYSPGVVPEAEGCIWDLEFAKPGGGTVPSKNRKIPGDYGGTDKCYYEDDDGTPHMEIANPDDAFQLAVFALFDLLDDNNDGVINIGKFDPDEINISVTQFTGIPFTWGTEVQVRKWD